MTGKFKAIVVGGGPTGLVMAHALAMAGIDWVLIERRDSVAFKTGATLFSMPQGVRILHQLGLMEKAEQLGSPLHRSIHTDLHGNVIKESLFFREIAEFLGFPGLLFDRQKYLQLLVETLPEREVRVKTGRRVVGIDTTTEDVVVKLDDSTVETGSIVIGADGIWSVVRQEMERLSGEKIFNPEYTGFIGLYGHGAAVEGLKPSTGYDRHDKSNGMAIQVFTTPTKTFWGCYSHSQDESGDGNKFKRYSETDAAAFAQDWLDAPLNGKVTFGDVWRAREVWGMTQVHWGLAKRWHYNRLVLVGDAVHKVTPNIGAGSAIGSESAVCLGNHLHALLQRQSQPDTDSLSQAFATYQAERMGMCGMWVKLARGHLDGMLWKNWWHRFKAFEVPKLLGLVGLERRYVHSILAKSVRLDYIPLGEWSGAVPSKLGEADHPSLEGIFYWWFILGALSAAGVVWARWKQLI